MEKVQGRPQSLSGLFLIDNELQTAYTLSELSGKPKITGATFGNV